MQSDAIAFRVMEQRDMSDLLRNKRLRHDDLTARWRDPCQWQGKVAAGLEVDRDA